MSNLHRNPHDLISLAILINEANFSELLRFIKVNHFAEKDVCYFEDKKSVDYWSNLLSEMLPQTQTF